MSSVGSARVSAKIVRAVFEQTRVPFDARRRRMGEAATADVWHRKPEKGSCNFQGLAELLGHTIRPFAGSRLVRGIDIVDMDGKPQITIRRAFNVGKKRQSGGYRPIGCHLSVATEGLGLDVKRMHPTHIITEIVRRYNGPQLVRALNLIESDEQIIDGYPTESLMTLATDGLGFQGDRSFSMNALDLLRNLSAGGRKALILTMSKTSLTRILQELDTAGQEELFWTLYPTGSRQKMFTALSLHARKSLLVSLLGQIGSVVFSESELKLLSYARPEYTTEYTSLMLPEALDPKDTAAEVSELMEMGVIAAANPTELLLEMGKLKKYPKLFKAAQKRLVG